jgi:hypothetical protein
MYNEVTEGSDEEISKKESKIGTYKDMIIKQKVDSTSEALPFSMWCHENKPEIHQARLLSCTQAIYQLNCQIVEISNETLAFPFLKNGVTLESVIQHYFSTSELTETQLAVEM